MSFPTPSNYQYTQLTQDQIERLKRLDEIVVDPMISQFLDQALQNIVDGGGSAYYIDPVATIGDLPSEADAGTMTVVLDADGFGNPAVFVYDENISDWVQQSGVSSVFGRTGNVTAESGDYTAAQVGAVALTGDESVAGVKTFSSSPIVPAPTTDLQAATKKYVDDVAAGLSWKTAVETDTTTNIDLSNPGTDTFNGYTISNGDRLLVRVQTDETENGIYVFDTSSTPLTRATDADSTSELQGAAVAIAQGNNQDLVFKQQTENPIIGVDDIIWVDIFSVNALTAGDGIEITGNMISVDPDNLSVENSPFGEVRVKDGGITNDKIGETILETKGGTGNSSYTTGDILYSDGSNSLAKLPIGSTNQVLGVVSNQPTWITPPSSGATTISYSKSLVTDATEVTVSDSGAVTTVLQYTIPANSLGTDGVLAGLIQGTYLNESGAANSFSVRVRLNSTEVCIITSASLSTSPGVNKWGYEFKISNNDSATAQTITANLYGSRDNVTNQYNRGSGGVATVDTTSDVILYIRMRISGATPTPTQTLTKTFATLSRLNATDDVGGGGGSMEIGEAVLGAADHSILYVDGDGNLAQDLGFVRNYDNFSYLLTGGLRAAESGNNSSEENFIIYADIGGTDGNDITITGDGSSTVNDLLSVWNAANPENTATATVGGTVIPDNLQEVTLQGGVDVMELSGLQPDFGMNIAGKLGIGADNIYAFGVTSGANVSEELQVGAFSSDFSERSRLVVVKDNLKLDTTGNLNLNADSIFISTNAGEYIWPTTAATDGQVLSWNEGLNEMEWITAGGGGAISLTEGHFLVGDGSNEAADFGTDFYISNGAFLTSLTAASLDFSDQTVIGNESHNLLSMFSNGSVKTANLRGSVVTNVDVSFTGSGSSSDMTFSSIFAGVDSDTITVEIVEEETDVIMIQNIVGSFSPAMIVTANTGGDATIVAVYANALVVNAIGGDWSGVSTISNGGNTAEVSQVFSDTMGTNDTVLFTATSVNVGQFGGTDYVFATQNGTAVFSYGGELYTGVFCEQPGSYVDGDYWEVTYSPNLTTRYSHDYARDITRIGDYNNDYSLMRKAYIELNYKDDGSITVGGGDVAFDTTNLTLQASQSVKVTASQLTIATSNPINIGSSIFRGNHLHNNAESIGDSTQQEIRSGTWTPTLTPITNTDSVTLQGTAKWFRVGNIVEIAFAVECDPTTTGATQFDFTLPVPSDFDSDFDIVGQSIGNLSGVLDEAGWVNADTSNDRGRHFSTASTASTHIHYIMAKYEVK